MPRLKRAGLLASFDAPRARAALPFLYNVSARHFYDVVHRNNVMRGLITHVTRRFGEDIVPAEVRNGLGG